MKTEQMIQVLERMRELLSDPDRVVLDPTHYFEADEDGPVVELSYDEAYERRKQHCRVCFCGAATLACWEVGGGTWRGDGADEDMNEVRPLLRDTALALGLTVDEEVRERFRWEPDDDPSLVMTSALKQGRAVEVVDAALASLRAGLAA